MNTAEKGSFAFHDRGTYLCFSFLSMLMIFNVQAAEGDLDVNFGTSGVVTTITTPDVWANKVKVLVQSDNKILSVFGRPFAMERHNSDGSIDGGFGSSGVVTDFPSLASGIDVYAAALQMDGRIVVGGSVVTDSSASTNCALLRYNSDGSIDTSFGVDGAVITQCGQRGVFSGITIQTDGKIVAAGISKSLDWNFMAWRFNLDGSLDSSWNQFSTYVGFSSVAYPGVAVVQQSDGRIVVAGVRKGTADGISRLVLLRFNVDGSEHARNTDEPLDGLILGTSSTAHSVTSLAIAPTGELLIAGWSVVVGAGFRNFISRFTPSMQLDISFGTNGHVIGDAAFCYNCGLDALVLTPDRKILVTGYHMVDGNYERPYVARYNRDGQLDTTFGTAGVAIVSSLSHSTVALALQGDGSILLAGQNSVIRLLGGSYDTLPDPFSFVDETNVANSSIQTSNIITIGGLGTGIFVPVIVEGGEYSLNGSSYQSGPALLGNGDYLDVRHATPATGPTETNTLLRVGGIQAVSNPGVAYGTQVSDTYTTTTQVPPIVPPTILAPTDGAVSNNNTPVVSGSSVPGFTVTLSNNGSAIATVVVDASGSWSHQVAALGDGEHTFTAIATDGEGNGSSSSGGVTIFIDTLASTPVILVPLDGSYSNSREITVSGTAEPLSTVAVYNGNTLLYSVAADASGRWNYIDEWGEDTYVFSAIATDVAGNRSEVSGSVTLIVDTSAPVVTPPANMSAEALSAAGVPADNVVSFLSGGAALDTQGAAVNVSHDAPANFPLGVTTVTFSATDMAGNTGTATALVTVLDSTAPIVTPPADITLAAVDENGASAANAAAFLTGAIAVDSVYGVREVRHNAPDIFPLGVTTVTFTANDGAGKPGNIGTATAMVTVIDQTPPVVTPPAPITVAAVDARGVQAIMQSDFLSGASAMDNVDGALETSDGAPEILPLGTTEITFSAVDAAGNKGSAVSTITVTDQSAPTIVLYPGLILMGDAAVGGLSQSHAGVQRFLASVTAEDSVEGAVGVSNDAPMLLPFGATTIRFRAEDSVGNIAVQSAVITINDPGTTGSGAAAPSGTGLTVGQSTVLGLDPNAGTTDTDGDGVADNLEVGDPLNPNDTDGDGVLDLFESGAAANDSSYVNGLATTSGSVDLQSNGQTLTQATSSATGTGAPSGVYFPYGVISYQSTVTAAGDSQTVRLTFSEPLPARLVPYKVDVAGAYSVIPASQWTQVNGNTVDLTLTDGGPFDLDGVANGVIVDSLALGGSTAEPARSSGGGGSASPWALLLLLLLVSRVRLCSVTRKNLG